MLITLALSKPRNSVAGARFAQRTLQALARWNAGLIRAGEVSTCSRAMMSGDVMYRRERGESFQDAAHIEDQGWGDCSNLAAWYVGELLAKGETAWIHIRWRRYADGHRTFHVLVRRENGTIVDPSRLLGM